MLVFAKPHYSFDFYCCEFFDHIFHISYIVFFLNQQYYPFSVGTVKADRLDVLAQQLKKA
jgi:hypothetical protein